MASTRRRWVQLASAVVLIAAAVGAVIYFEHAARYESTDDAFLDGHVIPVAPEVAGRVSRVLVDDNQRVEPGDLLVEIEPADFVIGKERAEAGLALARARLTSATGARASAQARASEARSSVRANQAHAALAHSDLERLQALTRTGAATLQQLDDARANDLAIAASTEAARHAVSAQSASITEAEAAEEAAKADLEQAQAAVAAADLALSRTKIVAQRAGRVTGKSVEPGAFVVLGQELLSIVEPRVWVTANFKETQLAKLRVGQPVSVAIDAYGHEWRGHVESFQRGTGSRFSLLPVENATGNYVKVVQRVPVKIVFDALPDPVRYVLAPGMSVVPTVDVSEARVRSAGPGASERAISER
jgi:membrane fusion protein (multidrug efflux system)